MFYDIFLNSSATSNAVDPREYFVMLKLMKAISITFKIV